MGRSEGRCRKVGALSAAIVFTLTLGACTKGSSSVASGGAAPITIPQPVVTGIPIASDAQRVDLTMPTFSDPTNVTNPLFPISDLHSVLMLGHVDGKPFRTEVTLLPDTRIIQWNGQPIETLVSQYTAYLGGRIQEVAYDLYAQADDGSVWYFGEDVADFVDGNIGTKEGTWLVGKDGEGSMIMPGQPQVGNAFRTENNPGIAFEEVSVKAVDQTFTGPLGPVNGGIVGTELHMDGLTEDKQFAPGYGEFYTKDGKDVEALALAVPTDAATGAVPPELTTMETDARSIIDDAGSGRWSTVSSGLAEMKTAWQSYPAGQVPTLIDPVMTGQMQTLEHAAQVHDALATQQAAIGVARSSLDLQLRYRPTTEIDLARLDLWASQLQVDAAAGDTGSVNGDVFTMEYIRDRIQKAVTPTDEIAITTVLQAMQVASFDKNLTKASAKAGVLHTTLANTTPTA